jgi:hypothetical protein
VVVAVGLTLTPVPLVAERLPGVITPVPFEKTPVRLELAPELMEAGLAVKLLMEGGVPPPPLRPPPPQAAIHMQAAETVARAAIRLKNFIFLPPKIQLRSFAHAASLPDIRAGSNSELPTT